MDMPICPLCSTASDSYLHVASNAVETSEAIKNQQRAVHLTPDGHTHFPARLSALGASFLRRFERSGSLGDLSEAIKIQQRAVQLTG